ncbi:phosphatidylglycerophosphatase A family protein [Paraburkholderia sacchari]|uniref:phosphatidylglycerophosphatase A family protein n=1 Tax=Paraburkholderia sacchari TaxID=159450 RepID=UPI001BD05570|nr:phosphatidylglycerophosphatase A [Paraburkholderia sacchari]
MQTDPTPSPADKLATSSASATHASAGPRRADGRFMLAHPLHLISLGFGAGLSRLAPGAAGTLFAWAAFEVLNRYFTVLDWGLLIVVGFLGGIGITGFTAKMLRTEDLRAIVWGEIVAFWLVLLMITPIDLMGKLWAFVVFRFFDMVKPPPIRYFERRLKGGFGIMLADLIAAFFTLLVIALWRMSV